MFCKECGSENPATARVCGNCGSALPGETLPPGESKTEIVSSQLPEESKEITPPDDASSSSERRKHPLYGAGGWLLLFCIGTAIANPLITIVQVLHSKNVLTAVLAFALAAFALDVGVSLWRLRPDALSVTKVYFIVLLVLAGVEILGWLYTFNAAKEAAEPGPDSGLWSAARLILFVGIWWSYFKKSKRVKVTFGRNL